MVTLEIKKFSFSSSIATSGGGFSSKLKNLSIFSSSFLTKKFSMLVEIAKVVI